MKKLIILAVISLLLSAGLFAAQTRAYTQVLVTPDGERFDDVNNTGTTHNANYTLSAYITVRPDDVVSTATHSSIVIRVLRFGAGTVAVPYATVAFLQFSAFGPNWAANEVVHLTITNNTTMLSTSWDLIIPDAAGTAIGHRQPYNPFPDGIVCNLWPAADETLTITSTPTGQPIWVNDAPTGEVTPFDFVNPTAGDIYSINNPLYTWAPVDYTVPADFMTATVDFVGTEIDTYLYKVNVMGPDGYAVTHVNFPGTTDYIAQADNEAALLGMYEIAAAPDGFHWAVNPIEVVAGGWTQTSPAGKATPGTRSNGAKVAYVFEKTIEFVMVENPPVYDVPADTPTPVGDITITSTGNLDLVPVAPDAPALALLPNIEGPGDTEIVGLTGTGTVDLTFAVGAGTWYGMLYAGGAWYQGVPFPLVGPGNIVFLGVNFDAKGDVIFVAKEGSDPTLPVVLSSFTAVLTAQNYVQLNWITESETNMLGFRVYRSETVELSDAVLITPVMIGATNTSSTQHYSVTDNEVVVGTTYNYWLESIDMGPSTFHGPQTVTVSGTTTPTLPSITQLGNAYPNPFRASTNINLAVKEGETATVTIYNILGQVVRTYSKTQGSHTINWDGRDARGNACGSGIYFYKLSSPSMNQTKKMVIVK